MESYEWLALVARTLTYVGSIGAAGSILLALTLRPDQPFLRLLCWQSVIGAALLIVSLPLTYAAFQLGLVGGDGALAFSEGFWNIFFQTGQGNQVYMRLGAALVLIGAGAFVAGRGLYLAMALLPAIALIALFGFEGHSTSFGPRWASAALIITHLAIVHWWFAVLVPLLIAPTQTQGLMAPRFSTQAMAAVPLMVLAGALFLAILADWQWPTFEGYFVRFAWKIGAFVLVLGAAAANKFLVAPGRALRVSVGVEMAFAMALLIATALLVRTSP